MALIVDISTTGTDGGLVTLRIEHAGVDNVHLYHVVLVRHRYSDGYVTLVRHTRHT